MFGLTIIRIKELHRLKDIDKDKERLIRIAKFKNKTIENLKSQIINLNKIKTTPSTKE